MTIASLEETRAQILGDGITDRIDLEFQFVDEDDLSVIHTDANGNDTPWDYQQSPGNWYFSGGDYAAGTVYFTASDLAPGERLTVAMTSRYDQPFSLEGGEIDPAVIQRAMDRTMLSVQAIAGRAERSLSVSPSLDGELPVLEVPDLPNGHTFVRQGDSLVPALIDSAAISAAVSTAVGAREDAEAAAVTASAASDSSEEARTDAHVARSAADAARSAAETASASAEAAQTAVETAADTAVTEATAVLGSGRIPVGAHLPWMSDIAPNQFWIVVKDVGQTFSRSLFPQLFDHYNPVRTVTITDGSPVVTGIGSDQGFAAGMSVEAPGVPAGTTIVSVDGGSQVTLSANATSDGTVCRVFRFGNGDGSQTAHFPSFAGRYFRGWDAQGAVNPDAGSALGMTQEDEVRAHRHLSPFPGNAGSTPYGEEASESSAKEPGNEPELEDLSHYTSSFGGTETRGKEIIGAWIVKVADGVDDPAILSAATISQELAQAQSDIEAINAQLAGTSAQLLGVGQAWQNVTSDRSGGTIYQNTTGRSIQVVVVTGYTNVSPQVSVDGIVWLNVGTGGGAESVQIYIIIPEGWYYRLTATTSIYSWMELR